MIIAHADTTGAAAAAPLATGEACELFVHDDGKGYVALLDGERAALRGWTFETVNPLFAGGRVGAQAGDWLFVVGLWVPAEQRDEFLAWYRAEHLPILLECPTWNGCRFVEAPAERGCQFHALHQLSDRRALASPERARSRATPWFERLKRFDWFDEPFSRRLCRRIESTRR